MEGVHKTGATSAAGTAIGGVPGSSGANPLKKSKIMENAGVAGKVTTEAFTALGQEGMTQTLSAVAPPPPCEPQKSNSCD